MNKNDYKNLESFFREGKFIRDNFEFNDSDFSDKQRLSDPLFKSIGYPSKIYYQNIQKYISSYTEPGGVVLDSCAGSGSTGIAALLENRRAVLIDNSPMATNMEYNLINFVDISALKREYKKLISELEDDINDIYKTQMSDGTFGYADVIIASNVYSCPDCTSEIVLYKNETGKRSEYKCPNCGCIINISNNDIKALQIDKRRPVEVTIYPFGKRTNKEVRDITTSDIHLWDQQLKIYSDSYGELWFPTEKIVYNRAYPRVGGWPGFPIDSSVSDLFPEKNLLALTILNNYIETKIKNEPVRDFLKFIFLETLFRTSSRLFTASGIKNVYHIPPLGKEQNVMTVFKRKFKAISEAKELIQSKLEREQTENDIRIIRTDAKKLPLPDNSIDYAFIDPPYGGMVPYAELNLFIAHGYTKKRTLKMKSLYRWIMKRKKGTLNFGGLTLKKHLEKYLGC